MFFCLDSGVRSRYPLCLFESGIIVITMSKRFLNAEKEKKMAFFGGTGAFFLSVLRFWYQGVKWHFHNIISIRMNAMNERSNIQRHEIH
jgi:hypothetical protein